MSLHIVLGHGIDFQQHGVVQPLDHLIIGEDLIIQLFQLGNLCGVSTFASHDEAAVAEVGVALGANALNACEGAVFDSLVIECANHINAALLVGLKNLRLVRDREVRFTLSYSLCSLRSGLVRSQFQLVAGTHRAEQSRCQESLGAGSAVNGYGYGVACLDIGLQIVQILEVQ